MATKFPTAESRENQENQNLYLVPDSNKGSPEYQHYYYTTIFGKTPGNTCACQNKICRWSEFDVVHSEVFTEYIE
jgi:hypothetical protein